MISINSFQDNNLLQNLSKLIQYQSPTIPNTTIIPITPITPIQPQQSLNTLNTLNNNQLNQLIHQFQLPSNISSISNIQQPQQQNIYLSSIPTTSPIISVVPINSIQGINNIQNNIITQRPTYITTATAQYPHPQQYKYKQAAHKRITNSSFKLLKTNNAFKQSNNNPFKSPEPSGNPFKNPNNHKSSVGLNKNNPFSMTINNTRNNNKYKSLTDVSSNTCNDPKQIPNLLKVSDMQLGCNNSNNNSNYISNTPFRVTENASNNPNTIQLTFQDFLSMFNATNNMNVSNINGINVLSGIKYNNMVIPIQPQSQLQLRKQIIPTSTSAATCKLLTPKLESHSHSQSHSQSHSMDDDGDTSIIDTINTESTHTSSSNNNDIEHNNSMINERNILTTNKYNKLTNNCDIKPYSCEYCNKSFNFKKDCVKHQTLHNGARPYHCHICTKQFATKSSLLSHIPKNHSSSNKS